MCVKNMPKNKNNPELTFKTKDIEKVEKAHKWTHYMNKCIYLQEIYTRFCIECRFSSHSFSIWMCQLKKTSNSKLYNPFWNHPNIRNEHFDINTNRIQWKRIMVTKNWTKYCNDFCFQRISRFLHFIYHFVKQ